MNPCGQDDGANACHEKRLFRLTAKRVHPQVRLTEVKPVTDASASVTGNGRYQVGAFLRQLHGKRPRCPAPMLTREVY
jgi:hypothetical protein